ncbi:MAG: aminotransferase class V-fold PLP-dependent enzyme [Haloarculaceae archaeon]
MDPEALRADIPVCEDTVYLNTGASGPSPQRVVRASADEQAWHEHEATVDPGPYTSAYERYEETREAVAGLLDSPADEIALSGSTADGISRVANAIDWEEGDAIVRTDLEHPAGIVPWARLREEGCEVREVSCPSGTPDMDELKEAVEGARLVCLNSISWLHGSRLPLREVADVAHDAGARVLVDAVQSPGQEAVRPREWGADAVVAAGHKWLLGTWGAGFVWVAPDFVDELRPRHVSYRSVDDSSAYPLDYHDGARRLEVGTANPAPYAALREAIEIHDELGLGTVRDRIHELIDRLKTGVPDERLVSPAEFESGLVAFEVEEPDAVVERLADRGVHVRSVPRPDTVRASVHVFNDESDIDALLDGLPF